MTRCPVNPRGALLALPLVLGLAGTAHAGRSWYVAPSGDDANDCRFPESPCATIQEAIDRAGSGDTVLVGVGTYTSTASAVVLIDKDLDLSGGWNAAFTVRAGLSAIDGQGARAGMRVVSGTVSGRRFAVIQGTVGIENSGTLTLTECSVENNLGGGIWNDGDLTVNDSTISGNTNHSGGGGIDHWPPSSRTLVLNNTTVSGNWTSSEGGGLRIGDGLVSLNSSTVTANSAAFGGGGIANRTRARLEFQNSIVAGNSAPYGPDCFVTRPAETVSLGYNLVGDTRACTFTPAKGDRLDVVAGLAPLLHEGGPTRTHGLLANSPALDAGNPGGCKDASGVPIEADQRGVGRPQGRRCDIGAFEWERAVCDTAVQYARPHGLEMQFEVVAPVPVRWTVWLHTSQGTERLWSVKLRPGDASTHRATWYGRALHGTVGLLSTLSGSDGVVCAAWWSVETETRTVRRRLP